MDCIMADASGNEIRRLKFNSYDFEVSTDPEANSWQVVILRQEWEEIPEKARVYIPGTEYGGLFRRLETSTSLDTISPGGLTWRGMLYKKIISPESGADYAYASGELNSIIKAKVEAEFPGLMVGSSENTGVTVTNYQLKRYCTLADGLKDMLESVGYRLSLAYDQNLKAVVVKAVPIVDYSARIDFSSDYRVNYDMGIRSDGVNHLICLGQGELSARTVIHLYVDANGNISQTQTFTGVDEVAEVYDYAGAEQEDLINSGTERLKELMNQNVFEIRVEGEELEIGDIVGGQDYLSGLRMRAPVAGKILRWQNGFDTVEYRLEDNVEIGG